LQLPDFEIFHGDSISWIADLKDLGKNCEIREILSPQKFVSLS